MRYVGNKPAQTTIPADDAVTTAMLKDDAVTSAKIDDGTITSTDMAVDPRNASNLNAGDVPLAQLDNVDTSGIVANQDDIALLGFKVAANGSLAKYNLVDQTIDAFEDASGVDASASTNETRDASGKYYSGSASGTAPTGDGTVATYSGYTSHTFLSSGDFIVNASGNVDWLVVAGGGIGGTNHGAGGGAGGVRTAASQAVTARTYTVTVGGSQAVSSISGGDISTYSASGGGNGGTDAGTGTDGGSGGAGSGGSAGGAGNSGGYTPVEGYAGGTGAGGGAARVGGGGGGASQVGFNGTSDTIGGAGGAGISNSYRTGSGVFYGGGGGGGAHDDAAGAGGNGGGGAGAASTGGVAGTAGTANTGGGGGGGSGGSGAGGSGGSGIAVIRFADGAFDSYANMTLVSNATTAVDGAPTTGDLVITYTDGAGTATVNTDIKAYVSRNGSAYTSAVTLVSQGTTGGHTILTANGVDLSGITTGTSMRWKLETLNQGVSKQTRIHAVSLGWS